MKIQGERDGLVELGQSAMRLVSQRATLPVLGGVKITAGDGRVEFVATDLEMFLSVAGEFVVAEKGSVVVPGRLMGEILKSLPSGRVTIEGKNGEIRVESGRSEFSVSGFPVSDFPQLPAIAESAQFRVDSQELSKALRQVVRAASQEETRPVLTGVLWSVEGGLLRLVATDSYRLAVKEVVVKEASEDRSAIIPGRALAEFGRHMTPGEVPAINLGETQASLEAGSSRLVTRLIEGEFPNYKQLIPDRYPNKLMVSAAELGAAVVRVGLVAQTNTPVKLHLGREVQVTASETGVGDAWEMIEGAEYEGEPMVAAFNQRFLGDGLEGVESESATIEFIDPTKPALIRGAGHEDFMYLIMPVRLPG